MTSKKKILSVYSHKLLLNRGTPLRVRSLLQECVKCSDYDFHTSSLEIDPDIGCSHLQLTGNNFKDLFSINKHIRSEEIDLVIFHTLDIAHFVILLKLLNPRTRYLLEMHGFLEEEELLNKNISLFYYYLKKVMYRAIYVFFDSITTCSDTASTLIKNYNKNTITIYGGVDLNKFNPGILPIQSFSESDGELVIGYSGNTRSWQGLDFLIESFNLLITKDDMFRLVLLLSSGRSTISTTPKVTILDPVSHEEVAKYNASFDILVIPRDENMVNTLSFPSKLMEYMAMGKPVVCSRTSDMHKIVTHDVNGLLYEPGNKEAFVEILLSLKDKGIRDNLSKNAYETVANKFTWKHQSKLLLSTIKATLDN